MGGLIMLVPQETVHINSSLASVDLCVD